MQQLPFARKLQQAFVPGPRGKSCLAGQAPHATLGPSQQSRDWAALFRQLTQPCSGRSLPPLCCRCVYLKSKRPEKTESKIRSRGVYYCPYRKLFTFTAATNAGPIPLLHLGGRLQALRSTRPVHLCRFVPVERVLDSKP